MMLKNYYNGLNSNKILLFTTRQLCYHSAGFFAAQLADALEKAGYICEMCEIPEDGIAGEMHEQAVPAKDTAGFRRRQQPCWSAISEKNMRQSLTLIPSCRG